MSQPTGPRSRLDVRGAVDLSMLNRPATPAPGTPGGLSAPGAYVVDVDQETFPDLVQSSTQHPVVVILWSPRSEASTTVAADLASLADEDAGRWLLARIDAEPNPPLHQAAYDAIERDDLPAATAAYEQALKENPRDALARAGLAQVGLLARTRDLDLQTARTAAAADPADVDAQLAVADLDILGGK